MNNNLILENFKPHSMLQVELIDVKKPKFPIIDAHNHLGSLFGHTWANRDVSELIREMDKLNVEAIIDLDGGFDSGILKQHLKHFKKNAPNRFIHFGGVDFNYLKLGKAKFAIHVAKQLEEQKNWGIQGIKVWKNLGLNVRDNNNNLIRINDNILEPLWEKAAELQLPIMIHVADPLAFFKPLDIYNERYEELINNPSWHFPESDYPPFESIISDFYEMVKQQSKTVFIGAHMGCYAENLKCVSEVLDCCPNFFVDTSARLAELGRQPYTSLDFFNKYQDRILFGTDMGMEPEIYKNYFRFFETKDEYFNYDAENPPGQGRWSIYGIGLEDSILEKIYSKNIKKLLNL